MSDTPEPISYKNIYKTDQAPEKIADRPPVSMDAILRELMATPLDMVELAKHMPDVTELGIMHDRVTMAEIVNRRLIMAAAKGQDWAIKMVFERVDGKAKQNLELGVDKMTLEYLVAKAGQLPPPPMPDLDADIDLENYVSHVTIDVTDYIENDDV